MLQHSCSLSHVSDLFLLGRGSVTTSFLDVPLLDVGLSVQMLYCLLILLFFSSSFFFYLIYNYNSTLLKKTALLGCDAGFKIPF